MTETQFDIFGGAVEVRPEEDLEEVKNIPPNFNVFQLTDAIGARNRKLAWVLYQKALAEGLAAEEIFWKCTWAIKTLLLASRLSSAEEAGLNPFVFKKNTSFLKNFTEEELIRISENLVVGYHNARRGIGEIETLIEKVILSL